MKVKILAGLVLVMSCFTFNLNAQTNMESNQALTIKQQCIVAISGFTAKGNQQSLKLVLNEGLDAGLTINEIKEILIQLYAYTGFPRSLNGLNTFMSVIKDREQKGIKDVTGIEISQLPDNKSRLELGTEIQTQLIGKPASGAIYSFAPAIDEFLKEHLFADIFGRGVLDYQSRELVTISALACLLEAEPQLQGHLMIGKNVGLSDMQLRGIASILTNKVGWREGNAINNILDQINGVGTAKGSLQIAASNLDCNFSLTDTIFPKGIKITNQNFTGNVWLFMMSTDSIYNATMGSVTFEPGARTNWHYHPGGQILIVTNGVGYYQEKGQSIQLLHKGDIIKCPPNVEHWHGASPNCQLTHIAISTNTTKGNVVWLKPVTNKEYENFLKK